MQKNNELYFDIENHLLQDIKPSVYLMEICLDPLFRNYPFDMLYKMKLTEQSKKHHPEGNVWNHTLLVVDEAAKLRKQSKNEKIFMWAALLHDIGKPVTTRNRRGKITSYDHDKAGAELSKEFLSMFSEDKDFIDKVCALVRYHMQILFVVNQLSFADIEGMKLHTDIHEVALLGFCDRMGRSHSSRVEEENNIKVFLQRCE